jgi:hypothetical protein
MEPVGELEVWDEDIMPGVLFLYRDLGDAYVLLQMFVPSSPDIEKPWATCIRPRRSPTLLHQPSVLSYAW